MLSLIRLLIELVRNALTPEPEPLREPPSAPARDEIDREVNQAAKDKFRVVHGGTLVPAPEHED